MSQHIALPPKYDGWEFVEQPADSGEYWTPGIGLNDANRRYVEVTIRECAAGGIASKHVEKHWLISPVRVPDAVPGTSISYTTKAGRQRRAINVGIGRWVVVVDATTHREMSSEGLLTEVDHKGFAIGMWGLPAEEEVAA